MSDKHPEACSCVKCIIQRYGKGGEFLNYSSRLGDVDMYRLEVVYTLPNGGHGSVSYAAEDSAKEARAIHSARADADLIECGATEVDRFVSRMTPMVRTTVVDE